MNFRNAIHLLGRGVGHVLWPWPSIKRTVSQMATAKQSHANNLIYIRDLLQRSRRKMAEPGPGEETGNAENDISFEQIFGRHPAALIRIAALKRRFLFQKRLALATAAAIITMSICAIANGRWLAIATILSSSPLLFMACLSAQLRLWQLRTRRLSRQERGGLHDYFSENPDWPRQVLDPEFSTKVGE